MRKGLNFNLNDLSKLSVVIMQSDRLIVEESQAIDLILKADENTSIIVDFDETLLLRNSTAEYLNSLRPRLIGFILLAILKIIKPWCWLPKPFRGEEIRDWFLVFTPTIFLPWTIFLWQQKAQHLAKNHGNSELITAINKNSHSPIIFASLGFEFIIDSILQHLPLTCVANPQAQSYQLTGCRFWQGATDRSKGKLLMMQETLSESAIASSIVITDSKDDLPLLQAVQYPCLIVWSLAKYISPFTDFSLSSLIKKRKS